MAATAFYTLSSGSGTPNWTASAITLGTLSAVAFTPPTSGTPNPVTTTGDRTYAIGLKSDATTSISLAGVDDLLLVLVLK